MASFTFLRPTALAPQQLVRRSSALCVAVLVFLALFAGPADADFGYAGGADPGISVDPGTGAVAVSLPALTQDPSSACRLVVSRSVGEGSVVEEGQFRAFIMDNANLATFLESLVPALAPGDTVVLDLTRCADVPADAASVSVPVTASAKLVPESSPALASSVWAPAVVLAVLALTTTAMLQRRRTRFHQ